jgi:hypothetical protein
MVRDDREVSSSLSSDGGVLPTSTFSIVVISRRCAGTQHRINPTLPTIAGCGESHSAVSSLIAGALTDPDAGALRGIAVVGLAIHGTWQYSFNGGTSWTGMRPFAIGNTSSQRELKMRFIPR